MPGDPVVWLLHGHKAGDNNQVLALVEALGWPYDIKRLAYRSWELLTNPVATGGYGFDPERIWATVYPATRRATWAWILDSISPSSTVPHQLSVAQMIELPRDRRSSASADSMKLK